MLHFQAVIAFGAKDRNEAVHDAQIVAISSKTWTPGFFRSFAKLFEKSGGPCLSANGDDFGVLDRLLPIFSAEIVASTL